VYVTEGSYLKMFLRYMQTIFSNPLQCGSNIQRKVSDQILIVITNPYIIEKKSELLYFIK